MARRGRKRQLDAESLYWQLILSGIGTVAACKEVGIGRKTGYRWRAENGVHRGADPHLSLSGSRGPGSTRRVAPAPTTSGCPHELCDLPVLYCSSSTSSMIKLSGPCGPPSGQARPPCALGEARRVEGCSSRDLRGSRTRRTWAGCSTCRPGRHCGVATARRRTRSSAGPAAMPGRPSPRRARPWPTLRGPCPQTGRPVRPPAGVYTGWKCDKVREEGDARVVTADLISRARAGDDDAFRELTEPHLRELQMHCYRMLGSFQDAEDAFQDCHRCSNGTPTAS
jgi:hypothetical protein